MYIKTLTIQGFKSYRDQTQVEPFSPGHNVVVGRNGSGKSNFFAAIRFVLSDAYTSMTREERQSLLHEGVSVTTTLSAYVEIIFDNSDGRFPTGKEEVILRRTIGLKKDEYSLDKKSASKADVMSLLESAGFSKSNPYYIVPQGRITALTNAKDHERLNLLKEVAGTRVYEQRRAESLRIMQETETKRNKIGELLEYIESRLAELEEEKAELKEYQEKDKDRRCLEYAMYSRELEEVQKALEDIEDDRLGEIHNSNLRTEQFEHRQKETQRLELEISEAKHELNTLNVTKESTVVERTDLVQSRTEVQCLIDDLESQGSQRGDQRSALSKDLSKLKTQIRAKERALQDLTEKWEEQRTHESTEKRQLQEATAKQEALMAKRGRTAKFRSKAERDAYLNQEIKSIKQFQTKQVDTLELTKGELGQAQQLLQELEQRITEAQAQTLDGRDRVKHIGEEITALRERAADLTENRKDLWREDTKLETTLRHAQDEFKSAERKLAHMMDKDTGMGLRAVDRISERPDFPGIYGPLYRLFSVTDSKYNTAVELTAGTSLFHVVVDTDTTATRVLDIMLKEKTGRVTFMPLNRLNPKHPAPPNSDDAVPLMEKLQYDAELEKALSQVFGKTCVCRDLTIAAAYVKSHGINTITLDGDKVDRRGALTGGYHDLRRSRLDAIKAVTSWKQRYEQEDAKSKQVKQDMLKLDQEITQLNGQITVLTNQQNHARDAREKLLTDSSTLETEKERLKQRAVRLETSIEDLEAEAQAMEERLVGYTQELRTPHVRTLTEEEETQLDQLVVEVDERQKQYNELRKARSELESQKSQVEIELNEGLRRRNAEVQKSLDSLDEPDSARSSSTTSLATRKKELQSLDQAIRTLDKQKAETDKELDTLGAQLQQLRASLDDLQNQQTEESRNIARQQKSHERYLNKRQILNTRKDECNTSIRDLGVLPEEAYERYVKEKVERLVKKLQTVNEALKKFTHVNKKAFEQYNNFTKQRDQLLERRDELEKSADSIEELIEALDQRKDEAIERTFKQVAENFEEVFEALVPAGRGQLIIQRRMDQEEEEETQQSTVDHYTGITIKVSFNSKVDEGLRIQQLSGGQKSLVALATVFAIQKCDPAPFYLFDEIDANLDSQYRTAVASMIQKLSKNAQFITTTFRPEMLVTADKFYGVLFNNQKVSSIRAIKREEAQQFVDQEAQAT
ncbi:RecF/RecN/SMC [Pterulicium gracile]|uniref:Structural maintenance of chromosomes protein n=1 Tax=Pterulicium gracile TaxID=1884261 RepID=A0A5C3QXT1_9AGAR|nr:RecF/RecN/SMC [Pterula gracilis]